VWVNLETLKLAITGMHRSLAKQDKLTELIQKHHHQHHFIVVDSLIHDFRSRDSAVGIATGNGLDDRWYGVRVPVRSRILSSPVVQTGSGAHPASYGMDSGGSFPGI
jgi:hypothetical protein